MAEPYIIFSVDKTFYAVPSVSVQQLLMIERITPVPNAPAFIEGVIYLRGQVVPVINLRSRFGLEKIPYDIATRLIVIQLDQRVIGLAVDSAREFVQINEDKIMPPPESLVAPSLEYLRGAVSFPDRVVLVVDLYKLLDTSEKISLAQTDAF